MRTPIRAALFCPQAAQRDALMADTAFAQILQTAVTLRNHIYSLSRKVRRRLLLVQDCA